MKSMWKLIGRQEHRCFPRIVAIGLIECGTALFLAGCTGSSEDKWTSQRPTLVITAGTVLLDDRPIEGAILVFTPVEDSPDQKLVGASGRTNSDGRFELTTYQEGDGIPKGQYTVTVRKDDRQLISAALDPAHPAVYRLIPLIAPRFGDVKKSPLKITIEEPTDRIELKVASK